MSTFVSLSLCKWSLVLVISLLIRVDIFFTHVSVLRAISFFYFSKLDDIASNTHIMTVLFMCVVCLCIRMSYVFVCRMSSQCILSVTVYKCFGVQSRQSKVHKIKQTQKGQSLGFSVYEQSSLGMNIGRV